MTRLILFEPAHRRVAAELERLTGGAVELALVSADGGAITLDGAPLTDEAAQPDWGWFSADSGFGPGGRTLFLAMLKSAKLAWVHTTAAGVDGPIWRQLVEKGAELTTGHGQAISIAEYVVAAVLEHYQRWPERHAAQAERRWARLPFREVAGTRWLIVGFGAIGEAVAERARAFGAHITGVRRSGASHPAADAMAKLADVRALLPEADVVVLAAPLNAETANLADTAFFAAMKARSVLVNIGRGGLVDEAALLAALGAGAPDHAILDVFRTEPLPEDSPLWAHPKVTLTAHASAFGSGQTARNDALFLENLRRRLAAEPMLYLADARDLGESIGG